MSHPNPFLSFVIASQSIAPELCATLDSFFIIQGLAPNNLAVSELRQRYAVIADRLIIGTEPDSGVYDAFNKAVPLCRGEWVAFVGTGDYCLNAHALEAVLAVLRQAPLHCDFCAFPIMTAFPSHLQIDTLFPSQTPVKDLPQGMCLPHPVFSIVAEFSTATFLTLHTASLAITNLCAEL